MMKYFTALTLLVALGQVCFAQQNDDRPYFGLEVVSAREVYDSLKEKNIKLPTKKGVLVVGVSPGGAGEIAGIRRSDVLVECNGEEVNSTAEFIAAVARTKVGQEAKLVGHSGTVVKGRAKYKRGSIMITPLTYRDTVLGSMKSSIDEFSKLATWSHREAEKIPGGSSTLEVYFVEKNGTCSLRMENQYRGSDWLFVKSIIFKVDDETFELEVGDRGSENTAYKIWEWDQRPVGKLEKSLIDAIVAKKSATIRYIGSQYKKDRELTEQEIQRLAVVMEAFRLRSK